jgi:hypothetical protein
MRRCCIALLGLLVASLASADRLELADGRVIEGNYRGGSADVLHFEIDGVVRAVPVSEVVGLLFVGHQPGASGAEAAPAPPAQPAMVRVPAGTRLRIRLADTLDPRVNAAGDQFSGLLDMELEAGGATVVAAGSRAYGRVSEVRTGPAGGLSLELTALQIEGVLQKIVSGTQQLAGSGSDAPAAPAPSAERIPAGTLLEFRLLQPFDISRASPAKPGAQ